MAWPLVIETPMGPLTVALTCGTGSAGAPDQESTLASGALVAQWHDLDGLMVDLLLTQYDGREAVPPGYTVPECWGMEWRFHAPRGWTPPVALSALLPDGANGSADADEELAVTEVWTDGWRLAVGGADEVWFARQVRRGGLARSWGAVFSEEQMRGVGGFGPWSKPRGLAWHLPALDQGESASLWVTAVWCPAGGPMADHSPVYAVDVRPPVLRAAAGVGAVRER